MTLYNDRDLVYSDYLTNTFTINSRKSIVKKLIKLIPEKVKKFDVIACSGVSGLLIAPIVSYELSKPLVVVRKQAEKSHYGLPRKSEGFTGTEYLAKKLIGIIIDDFIDSGATIEYIMKHLAKDTKVEPVAAFLYKQCCSSIDKPYLPDIAKKLKYYCWE